MGIDRVKSYVVAVEKNIQGQYARRSCGHRLPIAKGDRPPLLGEEIRCTTCAPLPKNEWDFDPRNRDQVKNFIHRITERLSEEEERMLLCLIECDEGLALLRDGLYK